MTIFFSELIMGDFEYVYSLVESECETDGYSYKGYGLRVQNTRTNDAHIYLDISTNRDDIDKLVRLCNELRLDIIHVEDVIEDALV